MSLRVVVMGKACKCRWFDLVSLQEDLYLLKRDYGRVVRFLICNLEKEYPEVSESRMHLCEKNSLQVEGK